MPHPDVLYRLGKIKQAAALQEAQAARLAAEARRQRPTPNLIARLLAYVVMLLTFMFRLGRKASQVRNDQTFLILKSRQTKGSTSIIIGARIIHR
jgi:hypothetical protein